MKLNCTVFTSIFFLCLLLPAGSNAQMFSIGDDNSNRFVNRNAPQIRLGIRTFGFESERSEIFLPEVPGANISAPFLSVEGTALHLAVESPFIRGFFSLGNNWTGLGNDRYLDFYIEVNQNIYLFYRPRFRLGIPARIGTSNTSVRDDEITVEFNDQVFASSAEFNQLTLRGAAGALIDAQLGRAIGLYADFLPGYGFSNGGFGFFGGNVFTLEGTFRFNLLRLFSSTILSVGYDYDYRNYDVEENNDNISYTMSSHMFTIGVSF